MKSTPFSTQDAKWFLRGAVRHIKRFTQRMLYAILIFFGLVTVFILTVIWMLTGINVIGKVGDAVDWFSELRESKSDAYFARKLADQEEQQIISNDGTLDAIEVEDSIDRWLEREEKRQYEMGLIGMIDLRKH